MTRALTGCGLLTLALFLSLAAEPEDKVVFLDVGQGDAILLQNQSRQVLIDGGPGMTVLTRLGEEMPWFDRKIEVVILTHPQRDHMEGLLHVLERYEVGLVVLPWAVNKSQMQEVWLQMIMDRGVPYRFALMGQQITIGDIQIQILGPINSDAGQAAIKANVNNASVMTRVDFCPEGTTPRSPKSEVGLCLSWLLTGDAEKRVEAILVNNTPPGMLDVDILKVGHHGSNSSTHEQLLRAASPSAAVISVSADNKFGHPREEVLGRLGDIPVWRTDEQGSVQFVWAGKGWLLSCAGSC